VASLLITALALFTLNVTTATQEIEKAFLQNNPKLLSNLFSTQHPINVSLPDPIFFSDQITHHQAYFVFKNIFAFYSTFEFYSEQQPFIPEKTGYIFKARWSFRDKKNDDQYPFYIFFFLIKETSGDGAETIWRISEIKAKKI
jgi:hypothetical protein